MLGDHGLTHAYPAAIAPRRPFHGPAEFARGTMVRVSLRAAAGTVAPLKEFAVYHDGVLVANVRSIEGLDDAVRATRHSAPYVAGLHIGGIAHPATAHWFEVWRSTGEKRDLVIRDLMREQSIHVTGAFIGAWTDGTWYELVIRAAMAEFGQTT